MKLGTALLKQLERCGLAAKLADEYREISDGEFRETRNEITRAWHANDQAQLPGAHAALRWLTTESGTIRTVGEPLDLVDPDTGEVLVTGKPGVIIDTPEGVLVVSWAAKEWHTDEEPDDDLGMLAMGMAAAGGRPFRVATVAVSNDEAFCRRSRLFAVDEHPALLARIKAAVARPRVACPGEWCGACKQAPYCHAWVARAKTSLAVFAQEVAIDVIAAEGEVAEVPQLDLTNDTAGQVMARIKMVRKAADMVEEQVRSFVRKGGQCVVGGKEYCLGSRDGRESVDIKALRAELGAGAEKYIKTGEPYEMPSWRNVKAPAARRR